MTQLFSLAGRTALVTGASRGLGQAMALALADAGADLVLMARSTGALQDTADAARACGRQVTCIGCDQADVAAMARVTDGLPPVDVLVNNAGVEEVRASDQVDAPLWDRIVDTNLRGVFFLTQAVAGPMLARGAGSVINLCSLTSFVGVPTAAPYGASKTGLLGLTRALSTEWAPRGVRVNAIAPGYFRTAMTEAFYRDEAWAAGMLGKIPAGRFGQGQDLAGVVVFLASDASSYVTGQCIGVDGGYLAAI